MLDDADLSILRALARGVDPATGEAFAGNHACQQPGTVRALCAAVAQLARAAAEPAAVPTRRSAEAPPKAGQPWDATEEQALVAAFDAGGKLGALAREFGRSRAAVEARLVRLGKLPGNPGLRWPVPTAAPLVPTDESSAVTGR
jgi:hypothetical protein